ncbi:hypothetical protein WJX73_000362 [Symbiochloris irregularis]|uniref:Glutathione S-transferase n=1 Tax=Symbiochloris irregularis TaxID=706552 RepID=A0AAW1NK38_9CHLO
MRAQRGLQSPVHYRLSQTRLFSLPAVSLRSHVCRSKGRTIATSCRALADIGSVLTALKRTLGQEQAEADPEALMGPVLGFADTAPSWSSLQSSLESQRQSLQLPAAVDLENGPTTAHALKRTFGSQQPPRLKLYRDSAAWCPYCEKVWLQLEEKQIPYTLEKINMRCYGPKPPAYTAKVPSGLLPAMELDGRLVIESDDIMKALEREFPDHKPLMPSPNSPNERSRAEKLLRLERRLFGDWLRWLTSSWNNEAHKRGFLATMSAVDQELGVADGPYFLGDDVTLPDLVFAPFLERIAASILYYKGLAVRGQGRWPNLDRWFDAMETRPTYLGIKSDFYTHVHDLPPQIGDCASLPEAAPYAAAIDGTDGSSWHLPLDRLSSTSLEPHAPGDKPERDRWQAANRLIGNHAAVTRFAARGCGQEGDQPVWAPLSDPSAKPGEQHLDAVSAALRHVAHALLNEAVSKERAAAVSTDSKQDTSQTHPGEAVYLSLAYLRDRVGVPRDLPFPAARQLRAHLNWFLDSIEG